ncbi:Transmembrane protein [Parasponia andersonii]|uniref:Transmembrane protein n=1 Tax=Parasponia andersonii TaxID=3476 RepID=A0A2P5BDI1_PARAD|nr:Transmembrane protein [Parasponia andersonii]
MASVKIMRARTVFFLVLIFFCGIISCQGIRTIAKFKIDAIDVVGDNQFENYAVLGKHGVIGTGLFGGRLDNIIGRRSVLDNGDQAENVPNAEKSTDDFRPTAPGHSPGAGHSHGPSSVDPNPK